jgi:hypothetical protein
MASIRDSQKVVIVTGDVTMDWNLARTRRLDGGGAVWNADDCTRAYWQRGGAAMLADLIEAVAEKLHETKKASFVVRQMNAPRKPPGFDDECYHHSYAMWSSRGDGAWRVADFLGLDSCSVTAEAPADWKKVVQDTATAEIVALDDADLGFRRHRALWPKAVVEPRRRPWVLLKMARPVAQGALWEHLHTKLADRLIVMMTVNDLRLTEVQISRELSWERTAQDIAWEVVHNPRVNGLSRCAHTIISFDTAGAMLISRPPAGGERRGQIPRFQLFFDPDGIEGTWGRNHPGGMIGYTSCLAAGIACQLMLDPQQPDIARGIQSGLAAVLALHVEGYGNRGGTARDAGLAFPTKRIATELAKGDSPLAVVDVEDPMRAIDPSRKKGQASRHSGLWTILEDKYSDRLTGVAAQIVLEGAENALQGVPLGKFGKLLTVDRREIESFRSIAALVGQYCAKARQKRPLSIAVFGAPGSGKSFGVTEVANSLLPEQIKVLEYNLSQFHGVQQLFDALHQVRDAGLSGLIPLVFWDEFDTPLEGEGLGWLRHFLAPMQDGAFQHGQLVHSVGRSIFVFAGGVYERMEAFGSDLKVEELRAAKGPDFVSRLKGYVNIMGPNRRESGGEDSDNDPHFIIRRAILLRSILLRDAGHLFEKEHGKQILNIDSGVLRALLETRTYKHGVRSIESVIAMSTLRGRRRFERSCLPAAEQLGLHVDANDFSSLVQRPELDGELLEKLAEAAHEVFCEDLRRKEYTWGPKTDDKRKKHSSLKLYAELPEEEKEQNRGNVRDIPAKLARAGYVMVPARSNEPPFSFPGAALETLAEMEHERWMKAKLAAGWRWGAKTDKERRIHTDLLPWRKLSSAERAERYTATEAKAIGENPLPEKEKHKDRGLIRGIPRILAKAGYTIVKIGEAQKGKSGT